MNEETTASAYYTEKVGGGNGYQQFKNVRGLMNNNGSSDFISGVSTAPGSIHGSRPSSWNLLVRNMIFDKSSIIFLQQSLHLRNVINI